jgi:hypothetical protein
MVADFSGYVTKAGLKCSDGRTITPEAFKHMNGVTVPLVYQHGHNSVDNVLGHMVLEARPDGVYGYGYFNDTASGKKAKQLVIHKDITRMSIYANELVEKVIGRGKAVLHGMIREVSLVLSGANPGALIDWVQIAHGDGEFETLTDEAVIHTGLDIEVLAHAEDDDDNNDDDPELEHATVKEVYDSMTEEQQGVVNYLISVALEDAGNSVSQSAVKPEGDNEGDPDDNEGDLTHQEGKTTVTKNVFEQNGDRPNNLPVIAHSDLKAIAKAVFTGKATLKEAILAHINEHDELKHGIENISVLFPDARELNNRPEFNQRRMEWVNGVLNATGKTPFAKVKTTTADITQPEARAKGYIKGEYKKEEWFSVTKRTTGPTTVYKKQKLDRDDIIDITDFDVVAWMWGEIEMMLKEELARAILIGDGREVDDEDKIKDPAAATDGDGIRSILNEHELFATTVNVNIGDANSSYLEVVDAVLRARRFYKGSGLPTFYTTELHLSELLLIRDEANSNRRLFNSVAELATALRVREIVTVEPMEDAEYADLIGIIVNLADYNIGTNRGGELTRFDDFDIDYNQYKYLLETRLSGALTKIKSALILKKTAATNVLVAPAKPAFDAETGALTITDQTGVVYKHGATTLNAAGSPYTVPAGTTWTVDATPAAGYYFATNAEDSWNFKADAV